MDSRVVSASRLAEQRHVAFRSIFHGNCFVPRVGAVVRLAVVSDGTHKRVSQVLRVRAAGQRFVGVLTTLGACKGLLQWLGPKTSRRPGPRLRSLAVLIATSVLLGGAWIGSLAADAPASKKASGFWYFASSSQSFPEAVVSLVRQRPDEYVEVRATLCGMLARIQGGHRVHVPGTKTEPSERRELHVTLDDIISSRHLREQRRKCTS